tara:strand:+ start:1241 stop:1456 length:216 start_codon:yes stop_codon:yes gene_type:complete
MYTKEMYLAEKNSMSKYERSVQERFEQLIEVLVLYKQSNPQLEVTISEKSINEAVQWFQGNLSELMNTFNK